MQLHAEYNRDCDDYMTHRVIQAFDAAQFIESTRSDSVLQILAGDLNTEPGDLAQRILLTTSRMYDAFIEAKDSGEQGTNECARNSYADPVFSEKAPGGKRIDYIMFRPGPHFKVESVEYKQPLADRVPNQSFSYSDHEAVHAQIKIAQTHSRNDENENIKEEANMTENNKIALSECIKTCDVSLEQLTSHRTHYTMAAIAVIVVLLNMIETQAPYGLKSLFLLVKVLATGLAVFFIFMASLWNTIERNGILSGKLSMEILLKSIEKLHEF